MPRSQPPKPPFTIGFFDDGEHRAGTGRYLAEIMGALDRDRYTPVFFAPEPRPWHEDLISLGAEMVYGEKGNVAANGRAETQNVDEKPLASGARRRKVRLPRSLAWSLGLHRETLRLQALFQKRTVDLLHSNNTGAEAAPVAARRAGIPRIVGTFHVLPSYDLKGERSGVLFRRLERRSMAALDRAIGCCEAAVHDWQKRTGFREGLATTIHNGIDLNRIERTRSQSEARASLGFGENEILIGAVGNLHPYKGHTHLLSAFRGVYKENPNVRLLIAGTGPEEASLKAQLEIYRADLPDLPDAVKFLGFCPDVRSVLEALDIFVQASLIEAFPIAILEASGMGIPVTATAVGGVPEAIREGQTGTLVPPSNPKALAGALLTLAQNPDLRRAMGKAGKERVCRHFTREKMVARTLEIYEELLKS